MTSTSVYKGPNPCVTVRHHSSTGLYRSPSAQRLSERTVPRPIQCGLFQRYVIQCTQLHVLATIQRHVIQCTQLHVLATLQHHVIQCTQLQALATFQRHVIQCTQLHALAAAPPLSHSVPQHSLETSPNVMQLTRSSVAPRACLNQCYCLPFTLGMSKHSG